MICIDYGSLGISSLASLASLRKFIETGLVELAATFDYLVDQLLMLFETIIAMNDIRTCVFVSTST